MTAVAPSVALRSAAADPIAAAARAVEDAWRRGAPDLSRLVAELGDGTPGATAALVKADLRCRFARGERPAVADYLARFPALEDDADRVVSLVYEEFCLLEERGERPDSREFCDRYEPWRDSLASQLNYHRLLSQVAGGAPRSPSYPEPGETFQNFRLRSVLGRGGMARVYLAQEADIDREVALKVSRDQGREPSILGRLGHPHIVPILSVAHEPATGLRGLCMPYRPGVPLDEVIRRLFERPGPAPAAARAVWEAIAPRGSPAEPADPGWEGFPARGTLAEGAAWVVATLARALEHAHGLGILHNDVKPANVLMAVAEGPQLLDFNLSHDPFDADRARSALRGGTLPYMAPEQLDAFLDPARWGAVDRRADVFALGLVLRDLVTGDRPVGPDPVLSLPRAINDVRDLRARSLGPARALNPGVPHALDAILAKCLANDPAARYATADALAEDLDRFRARLPLKHVRNPSRAEAVGNWARRRRLPIAAILTLAVVVGLVQASGPGPRVGLAVAAERAGMPSVVPVVLRGVIDRRETPAELERAIARRPRSALLRVWYGLALLRCGRAADAGAAFDDAVGMDIKADGLPIVDAFRRATTEEPNVALVWLGLGAALIRDKDYDAAGTALERAVRLDPGLYTGLENLAYLALIHDRLVEAIRHLDGALLVVRGRPDLKDRDVKLARLYAQRASVAAVWGRRLHDDHIPPDPRGASRQFRAALDDFRHVRDSWGKLTDDDRLRALIAAIRARLGLDELGAASSDLNEARTICSRLDAKGRDGYLKKLGDLDDELAKARSRGPAPAGRDATPSDGTSR
ncbi:MAG TPA: protein kinase [Isosphaeraceae bacterium]|jgi:serine/threonine protein kinase|nr:protein kinase [Isosphaeraceae bacterium]